MKSAKTQIPRLNKYLYLLKLKDRPYFKIGYSSGDLVRIKTINSLFEIDVEGSFIITSDNNDLIKSLETTLLRRTLKHTCCLAEFDGIDGNTEIREIECFPFVIDEINKQTGITINNLSDFTSSTIVNGKTRISFKYTIKRLDIFFTMRFTDDDMDIYESAKLIAKNKGISIAELTRQLLRAELERDNPAP